MTIRNRPNYEIFTQDLSVAGQRDLPCLATKLVMVNAIYSATGLPVSSAVVDVQIGKTLGDPIPFGINTRIDVENKFDYLRLSWAAQPGVTAYFLMSDDADGNGVDVTAPVAMQLVTTSAGTQLTTAQITVGSAATLLQAATATRQSVTVKNLGNANLYVGGAGVTTATGFPIAPGDAMTFSGTTATLYGIAASGGLPAAVIQEA